jgi:hypothetical protein
LDFQKTRIGVVPDGSEGRQVFESAPDGEVSGIVDSGFSPQGALLLEVLFNAGVFVFDM